MASTLQQQYSDSPILHELSEDARLVVSEPLGDLRGAWRELPESTCLVVRGGQEELRAIDSCALGCMISWCEPGPAPARVAQLAPELLDAPWCEPRSNGITRIWCD